MPFGLVMVAGGYFLFVAAVFFVLQRTTLGFDSLAYILPPLMVTIFVGMIFFALAISLLSQQVIYQIVLIALYLASCSVPNLVAESSSFSLDLLLLPPLLIGLSLLIVTFPLVLMRVLAGWRLTCTDVHLLERFPFSITKIFAFMIGIGIFFGIVVGLTNFYQDRSSINGIGFPFVQQSLMSLSIWLFVSGLIHLPIFILGLRLKINYATFWIVVVVYWLLPIIAFLLIGAFSAGPAPPEVFGLLVVNSAFNAFGFAALVMMTRSFGYRLMFVPITTRPGTVAQTDEDSDPFAD